LHIVGSELLHLGFSLGLIGAVTHPIHAGSSSLATFLWPGTALCERVATLENVQILQKPVSEESLEAALSAASHAARHKSSRHLIALP
jgi:hypothetical protein